MKIAPIKITSQYLIDNGYSENYLGSAQKWVYRKEDVFVWKDYDGFRYNDGTEIKTDEDLEKCIINEFGED